MGEFVIVIVGVGDADLVEETALGAVTSLEGEGVRFYDARLTRVAGDGEVTDLLTGDVARPTAPTGPHSPAEAVAEYQRENPSSDTLEPRNDPVAPAPAATPIVTREAAAPLMGDDR